MDIDFKINQFSKVHVFWFCLYKPNAVVVYDHMGVLLYNDTYDALDLIFGNFYSDEHCVFPGLFLRWTRQVWGRGRQKFKFWAIPFSFQLDSSQSPHPQPMNKNDNSNEAAWSHEVHDSWKTALGSRVNVLLWTPVIITVILTWRDYLWCSVSSHGTCLVKLQLREWP